MITDPAPAQKRILIVEDDPVARSMLGNLLGERYSVELAVDGIEGLNAALRTPGPDLIVTDVGMPRLDGISMVREIRARCTRKVPVIFLTGHDDPMHTIAGIAAGARHYVAKPIDVAKLDARIKKVLGC